MASRVINDKHQVKSVHNRRETGFPHSLVTQLTANLSFLTRTSLINLGLLVLIFGPGIRVLELG